MSNKNKIKESRRNFLKLSTAIIGGMPLLGMNPIVENAFRNSDDLKVYIFSKHLQFLNYQQMAEAAKDIGFDGVDLTIRPKGHILPERVEEDLPKATKALKDFGLTSNMFTTQVTDPNDPLDRKVLETACKLGYQCYRMGWLKYPIDQPIPRSIELFNKQFKALALLNQQLGLTGGYQNHAGNHVGAPVWDIDQILDGISPDHLGCQYDIRHAIVEGGSSWELGLRLLKDHINSLVIKDFKWEKVNGEWKPGNTPLGEGMVNFKKFFQLLKQYKINVPISLHLEYDLGGAEKGKTKLTIPQKEVFEKMRNDLLFLRHTWDTVE